MHARLKLAAATAIVLASGGTAVVLAASEGEGAAGPAGDRAIENAALPDLDQRPPYGVQVSERGGRFRLGFASAVENVGAGPLMVEAKRPRGSATMTGDQVLLRRDARRTAARRRGVARLRYVESPDHSHWHYLGFERYELRTDPGYRPVGRDRKTGFCLGDRYDADPRGRLRHKPPVARWTGECGRDGPRLFGVSEGISVGYGDDYKANLEGQFIDVTGLPAGRYHLVHRVNADKRLLERRHGNNAAAMLIELTWPDGPGRAPAVRRLASCETERCRP